MPRRKLLLPLLALGMVLLFAVLLVQLLLLRYERGDVYPRYSTLRADPLGTRAFYEALQATGRYQVSRGFKSVHRELEDKPQALFFLGLSSYEIPSFTKDEIAALDTYVKDGGRVIMTLMPEEPGSSEPDKTKKNDKKKAVTPDTTDKKTTDASPDKKVPDDTDNSTGPQTQQEKYEREQLRKDYEDDPDDQKDKTPPEYQRSLAALWGFGWEVHTTEKKKSDDSTDSDTVTSTPPDVFAHRAIFGGIEPNVPWKSATYFVRLEPDWVTLYDAKDKPVMIRRHWGKGEIVIATDSYFISNEALRNDRRPQLLSLIAGWPGELLFDEAHLGTEEQEGVMNLAEKFRLEGFLYGMIAVLLLFLWRNSMPLVPPRDAATHLPLGGTISGKDSRSGLINLLRRNIPPSEILKVCLSEWKRGITPRRARLYSQLTEMEAIVTATSRQPDQIIQSYQNLSKMNAPGKTRETHATKS